MANSYGGKQIHPGSRGSNRVTPYAAVSIRNTRDRSKLGDARKSSVPIRARPKDANIGRTGA